jgi:hypothetical protein
MARNGMNRASVTIAAVGPGGNFLIRRLMVWSELLWATATPPTPWS